MAEKKRKTTKYQRFVKAASRNCRLGTPASRESLKKAEKAYRDYAKKSGKSSADINKTAARVKACKMNKKK